MAVWSQVKVHRCSCHLWRYISVMPVPLPFSCHLQWRPDSESLLYCWSGEGRGLRLSESTHSWSAAASTCDCRTS